MWPRPVAAAAWVLIGARRLHDLAETVCVRSVLRLRSGAALVNPQRRLNQAFETRYVVIGGWAWDQKFTGA